MASHGLAECRLTVAGGGGVGKSCLVIQMVQSHFVDEYDPTIEDSYRKQRIIDDLPILVEILDTAGQEEYAAMREQWIRESQAIVLVYSVTSRASFEGAWEDGRLVGGIRQLHNQILRVRDFDPVAPYSRIGPSTNVHMIANSIPIMLVGNKCDLERDREVSMDEGRSLAAELGCMFVEVSAKSCINVDKAFDDPVREHFRLQKFRVTPKPLVDSKPHSPHRRAFSSPALLPKLSLGSPFQRFLKAVKVDIRKERQNDPAHQKALDTVLVQACRRNDLHGVQKCLTNGADPNVLAGTDGNALHTACALGHTKIVNLLLQNGAKPEVKGSREMTALQLASSEGHLKAVKILLKANAYIDTANPAHGTALVAATARGKIEVVNLLLKHGANVNIEGGQYGGALHTAAVLGNVDLARLLLHNGASVFQRGKQKSTALQLTCRAGHPRLVQLLLDHGSDPNALGGELGCAHEAAIRASRSDVFDLLAERADPARCASHCRTKLSPAHADRDDGTTAGLVEVNSALQPNSAFNRSTCSEPTSVGEKSAVLSPKDYSVGIVCPMAIELISVEGMLDKFHPNLSFPNSQNIYVLGAIGEHNVVVTVMPEVGNNHAAIVATQLRNDFPTLRCVLLVGVGGGLPNKQVDIRMGDVVISNPTATGGGVIQYDFGKHLGDGQFVRTGQLPKPPAFLNAAVHRLEARHALEGSQIQVHLAEMLARYPRTTDKYKRPADEYDLLFASEYSHQPCKSSSDPICARCDRTQLLDRPPRMNNDPVIHFGTVGSANALIKSSTVRDRLKRDSQDMICVVEMEAAGLMESFPCLVIRGICDYGDSHKNKIWQPYAAAVAAGYMKELVLTLPPACD